MNKEELNERLFDELLAHAAEQRMENMANEFPSEEELNERVAFSPEFEKKMQGILNKAKKKDKAEANRKRLFRIGIPAAVFVVVCFTVVTNVQALRIPVLNFFNSISKQSTTIQIKDNPDYYNAFTDQIKELYLPTYIPDTYKIKSINKDDVSFLVQFENGSGEVILFENLTDGSSAGVDSEGAYIEQLTVNGKPAQLFIKNNISTLIYEYEQNVFELNGSLSRDELIKMAQSIEYRK